MKEYNLRLCIAMGLIVLLFLAFVLQGVFRQPAKIHLPEQGQSGISEAENTLGEIMISPSTVQRAIASLERPKNYAQSVSLSYYYGEDTASTTVQVRVYGKWTRTDLTDSSGSARHVITNGDTDYIWYGNSREFYQGKALFNADTQAQILTYEDVLSLPQEDIITADFRNYNGAECICVTAKGEQDGYTDTYWVKTQDGLLYAAEIRNGSEVVYRMSVRSTEYDTVSASAFTLPNGKKLTK